MFYVDILAVVVEEAVILGAMSEFENFNAKTFCSITKTVCFIYIFFFKIKILLFIYLDSSLS